VLLDCGPGTLERLWRFRLLGDLDAIVISHMHADGSPSDAVAELAADADLLILEATFSDDARSAAAQGHMTAVQAGELARRARAKRLVLTHLLPGNHEALRALAEDAFGDLAHEGMTVDLPAGALSE
jgi:ribonuclease BN (tRNA processing enzyme)